MTAAQFLGVSCTLDNSKDSFERIAYEAIAAYKRRTGKVATTLFVHPFSPFSQLEKIGLVIQKDIFVLPGQVIAGESYANQSDLQTFTR